MNKKKKKKKKEKKVGVASGTGFDIIRKFPSLK